MAARTGADGRQPEVRFKHAARVPPGVNAGQVVAELDAIEQQFGRKSVDDTVKAVIAEPDRYPSLRAFGPPDAETAFIEAMRAGIEYAVRIVVKDSAPGEPETRLLHVVHDPADGAPVWADVPAIAQSESYQVELTRNLRRDAEAFSRKLVAVFAELESILGG
jgi:hypothetical protein